MKDNYIIKRLKIGFQKMLIVCAIGYIILSVFVGFNWIVKNAPLFGLLIVVLIVMYVTGYIFEEV